MIEFVIKDRRLRLHPDGVMYARAFRAGKETKDETWNEISFSNSRGYDRGSITIEGTSRKFSKHRLVWYAHHQDWDIFDESKIIDHINRNKTDNHIGNLHVVTQTENMWNTDAKGYCWDKSRNKWMARIRVDYKHINLGRFDKEEDAAKAYEDAKKKYHNII